MAIDSKQKRGSLIGHGMPWRSWLSEPSGTIGVGSRLSLLKYYAGTAAAISNVTGGCVSAIQSYFPGVKAADKRCE